MKPINENGEHVGFLIYCPGCDMPHQINVKKTKNKGPVWGFNGDLEKPTFSPSLKVTWRQFENGQHVNKCCHSFIRDGKWQFLKDSTHALAGQTVPIDPLVDIWGEKING